MQSLRLFDLGHLISFCTVQLWTFCAARSLVTLCLSTTSGPCSEELHGFLGYVVFHHTTIPRKGSGNNNSKGHYQRHCTCGLKERVVYRFLVAQLGEPNKVWVQSDLDKLNSMLEKNNNPFQFLCQALNVDPNNPAALDIVDK